MTVLLAALTAFDLVAAGMAVVNAVGEQPLTKPERVLLAALICAGAGCAIAAVVLS